MEERTGLATASVDPAVEGVAGVRVGHEVARLLVRRCSYDR